MERMIERCAGLDVHQATVVACILINERGKRPRKELRTFGTMTHELEALRDWLAVTPRRPRRWLIWRAAACAASATN